MSESQNELWARIHQDEHRSDERKHWKELEQRLERIEEKLDQLIAFRSPGGSRYRS